MAETEREVVVVAKVASNAGLVAMGAERTRPSMACRKSNSRPGIKVDVV